MGEIRNIKLDKVSNNLDMLKIMYNINTKLPYSYVIDILIDKRVPPFDILT